MVDYDLVQFHTLTKDDFDKINKLLMEDKSVFQFVSFHYHALVTNGIFYNNELVGVFNLHYFFENSISLSIAILKKYRGLGIAKTAIHKIVAIYGNKFPNVNLFIANVSQNNYDALLSFEHMGLTQTHEFDEIMLEEGSEFFSIFYEENPYRKLVKNDNK